eukprot:4393557-Pyramimonas_sp.AAC.1
MHGPLVRQIENMRKDLLEKQKLEEELKDKADEVEGAYSTVNFLMTSDREKNDMLQDAVAAMK